MKAHSYSKTIKKLEKLVSNEFERTLLIACFKNLSDLSNPLRFNNFAYSIRELSRHILRTLSPDEKVKECVWYKNESGDPEVITRGERIKYAIQGGLTDSFVHREIVEIEYLNDLKTKVVKSIELLNKFTHVNKDTFNISEEHILLHSKLVIERFEKFAEMINESKMIIIDALEQMVSDEVIETALWEVRDEIDILSTHHSINEISVEQHTIREIKSDQIIIEATGTIYVTLQYGSNGDLRRGDGLELRDSFPFTSILSAHLAKKIKKSKVVMQSYVVDTDSWYEED